MGFLNRGKQATKGVGEVVDDVRRMGFIGAGIKRAGVFSERNANAVHTVGQDVAMRR